MKQGLYNQKANKKYGQQKNDNFVYYSKGYTRNEEMDSMNRKNSRECSCKREREIGEKVGEKEGLKTSRFEVFEISLLLR